MTIQRMVELLQIEHECMLRGSHDGCDRNCADCELVQDDYELHEMYTDVIALLKEQEPQSVIVKCEPSNGNILWFANCPKCGQGIERDKHKNHCGYCGQAVKWDENKA